jgi:phosphonate transport system substrate-binding protein
MSQAPLVLGAVAYDPKVVTIWSGFRHWLRCQGFDLDFVLYAHYERLVEDLVANRIDVAWCSPLAWVRARRMAEAQGEVVSPLVMRDTDQDLTSVVVVRSSSSCAELVDLAGATVAVGAIDSPQATLIPLSLMRSAGLTPAIDLTVRRFDIGVGLHGDHIGGERDGVRALLAGQVEAACMLDASYLLFGTEGTVPPGATRVLARTDRFDHCVMVAHHDVDPAVAGRFTELLLSMSYDDPEARRLLDLEGLNVWRSGRTEHFGLLERGVDEAGFYDATGACGDPEYRP